jgi:hypothetical protein
MPHSVSELNLNVASTNSFFKNDNNSFSFNIDLSYSVKIYLIGGNIVTDIMNAILTIGPHGRPQFKCCKYNFIPEK